MIDTEEIENLKLKLKSAIKLKLIKESELVKLRNQERCLTDELANTKNEVEFLTQQIEDTKRQLTQMKNQIAMIGICTKSEDTKIEMYMNTLNNHKKGYEALFQKERDITDLRNQKQKEKEAEEEEQMRQKEKEIMEKNAQIAKDAEAIERECEAIEKKCTILKKKNNALMIRQRKLLATEYSKSEMRQRNIYSEGSQNNSCKTNDT